MNFQHGSVNDILKKIAIGLIPVQDRTAVIDVVIKYLSQAIRSIMYVSIEKNKK